MQSETEAKMKKKSSIDKKYHKDNFIKNIRTRVGKV